MKRTTERGSTITELALVTPVFLALIFGLFEVGLLLRDDLTLGNAAQSGARAAAVASNDANADFMTLRAVEHGMAAWGVEELSFAVIYRATGPDDDVPPACLSGPVASLCNYYRPVDFRLPYEDSNGDRTPFWGCGSLAADAALCPTDRPADLGHREALGSRFNDGPAYIGIYLEAEHDVVTNMFGDAITITEQRVIALEPRQR